MLARRLEQPVGRQGLGGRDPCRRPHRTSRWRTEGRRPTHGPAGEVRWWERPAPRGDVALWEAVKELQRQRLRLGVGVTELARRLEVYGYPIARETLSKLLNGTQATTWATAAAIAEVLDVDVDRFRP